MVNTTISFICDKCGKCCKILQYIPELNEYDRGDGICKYLNDNLCTIYTNRPDICNVEKTYEKFSHMFTKEEYYQFVTEYCKQLKQKAIDDP